LIIKKATISDVGNLDPGLGQTQKGGEVKLVDRIATFLLFIIGSPMAIQI
jgi:hypothetical protein